MTEEKKKRGRVRGIRFPQGYKKKDKLECEVKSEVKNIESPITA